MKKFITSLCLLLTATALHAKQDAVLIDQACLHNGAQLCRVVSVQRNQLENNLAHYEILLKVGNGAHDLIGLHRVLREPGYDVQPITAQASFLVHGDASSFGSFISSVNSTVVRHDHSLGIQMALANIDVWGVDLRWTKVGATVSTQEAVDQDFSFMRNWGLTTDLKDLDIAITVARNIRRLQGNVDAKLNLLGWSRGGQLGYLYLAKESQLAANNRQIKNYIPVDTLLKTNDESIRQAACTYASDLRSQWGAGQFADQSGLITQQFALFAQTAPNEPSPFVEGVTNKQAALLLLTSTVILSPPGSTYTPNYHYNGGKFDETGMPVNLAFANLNYLYEYATGAAPYEPTKMLAEMVQLTCNTGYGVLDNNLGRINIPMLYVHAAGGFGKAGIYTMKLTAHADKSVLGIQTLPSEMIALDYGHLDLFTAADANTRVWRNIISWIQRH